MEWTIKRELSFSEITLKITRLGKDYNMVLWGGERPHIGCVVLAVPRPSLQKGGDISVTTSVLNMTGHKDETLCRLLAEKTAQKTRGTVVCSGGFHVDNILEEQIEEVIKTVKDIAGEITDGVSDYRV